MKQKGFSLIPVVLSLILVILIAAGAYFLGKSQVPKPQPTVIPSVSTSVTPDETANWKIYTSAQYGYSVKFPPTWSVTDTDSQNPDNTSVTINSNEKFPSVPNDPEPITYWINIQQRLNPNHKEFKDFVTADLSPEIKNIFIYKTDVINGLPAYRTTTLPSRSGCEFVYFKKVDDSYIEINFCIYDAQKPFIQQDKFYTIFNQILSTFKFI